MIIFTNITLKIDKNQYGSIFIFAHEKSLFKIFIFSSLKNA